MRIPVTIHSRHPISIEADADQFGLIFAHMADDDQVHVLRAMVEHMRPHRQQWDFISIALEKVENRDVRDELRRVLFPEGAA